MIKNIFIPNNIGSFYIFTERTVALKITKTNVIAAVVAAHGSRRKIEQVIEEPIVQDLVIDFQERAAAAIKSVMSKVQNGTNIIAIIPSASIIFKEITVPYMSTQKMKMIVPFEIEPMLPFSLETAFVDSIVTHEDSSAKQAHLLVATIKQDVLQNYLAPFTLAGVTPQRVTTDILELYSFYCAVPEYKENKETTILLYIGTETTQVGLIVEHQLKAVRVLHGGATTPLNKILADVMATAQGFMAKVAAQPVTKIILCGPLTENKDIPEHVTEITHVQCQVLTINKLLYMGATSSKSGLSNECIVPLATALLFPTTADFDLNQPVATGKRDSLIGKQLIVAGVLIVAVLSMLLINSILTKRSLNNEIKARETETISLLKKQLDLTPPKSKTSLSDIKKLAQIEVAKKEDIWFALSSQNRFAFLTYLQELSTRLDREKLGLELRQLTLNEDSHTMTLEGQVKNFAALSDFEEALGQSSLFKTVSKPQDIKFSVKIMLEKQEQ